MEEKYQPFSTMTRNEGHPYELTDGKNSQIFEFDEIHFQEFTEIQIINAWIPYYLCSKLKQL